MLEKIIIGLFGAMIVGLFVAYPSVMFQILAALIDAFDSFDD